ncbi:AbrB/MazE/SpoVT family DNA-binding domain-containing protein [uncultured Desulfovibrio sp.]|uniref:AbrB/MazE/SpoVT family DNA-binding domain-containing protein n=1 Tax=uncultured Desulfovibrio sp. TaxID=167968 RepID=UPI0026065F4B|nr:AbrB/MazE/SpoVT family DNA-binding domain-containing protein [uncultured Desulfovibrio sp.]
MELAKLTSRCQLTLPREVRQKLGVKEGDKVVFLEENGRIFIENAEKLKLAPNEHSGGKE